jgi:D-amino-acid dehydrogenase
LAWRLRANNGVVWDELTGAALRACAPDLLPHYGFAARVAAGAHCANPGAYVAALVAYAQRLGAVVLPVQASHFRFDGAQLKAVVGANGEWACDNAVIATGIHSKALARAAGERVCLESERGYHVELPHSTVALPSPIMPSDGKMANTRCEGGLRAAGQVELSSVDAPPNWARADVLLHHVQRSYGPQNTEGLRRWMGHRPSTATGLPIVRASKRSPQLIFAFGHGHVGLAAAPATAERVADLLTLPL